MKLSTLTALLALAPAMSCSDGRCAEQKSVALGEKLNQGIERAGEMADSTLDAIEALDCDSTFIGVSELDRIGRLFAGEAPKPKREESPFEMKLPDQRFGP